MKTLRCPVDACILATGRIQSMQTVTIDDVGRSSLACTSPTENIGATQRTSAFPLNYSSLNKSSAVAEIGDRARGK